MEITMYSKKGCMKCLEIKSILDNNNLHYAYIEDAEILMEKALDLKNKNQLIEMVAPIIIIDGNQIKHKDLKEKIKY